MGNGSKRLERYKDTHHEKENRKSVQNAGKDKDKKKIKRI